MERGVKDNEGKLRVELIPPEAIVELAKVYTDGSAKYTDFNWERGIPVIECLAAMERHILRFKLGQDISSAGTHEMAHVAFWALALVSQHAREIEVSDYRHQRKVKYDAVKDFLES